MLVFAKTPCCLLLGLAIYIYIDFLFDNTTPQWYIQGVVVSSIGNRNKEAFGGFNRYLEVAEIRCELTQKCCCAKGFQKSK